MAIRIQDSAVVTDVGTGKVVLSDGSTLKLIEATDLPGGSGGGGGLTDYTSANIVQLPGFVHAAITSNASQSPGQIRAYYLPPGDYTGMSACELPVDTAAVGQLHFGLYAVDANATLGSLVTDLGEATRAASDPLAPLKSPVSIGVQNNPTFLTVFTGATSGNWRAVALAGSNWMIPQPFPPASSGVWRYETSVSYPASLPATWAGTRAATTTTFLFLAPTV